MSEQIRGACAQAGWYGMGTATGGRQPVAVQVQQPVSMGREACVAEELSMAFSSLANARLSSRTRISDVRQQGLRASAATEEMLAKVPDVQRRALDDLVAWLRQHPGMSQRELADCLEGFSGEVCHRYLALAYARQALGDTQSPLPELLDQALAHLEHVHGQAIELGIQIGPLALEAQQQGVADVAALRGVYRDFLCGYGGLKHAWDDLRVRFGGASMAEVAQFMLKGLANHLSGPSCGLDSTCLQQVVTDMKVVQALKQIEGDVAALMRQMAGESRGIRAF